MLKISGKRDEFITILERVNPAETVCKVFSDWHSLTALSCYRWKKKESTENEYSKIVSCYSKEDREKFSDLLSLTISVIKEQERDFLGDIYASVRQKTGLKARTFTPRPVSDITAKMAIGRNEFKENKYYVLTIRAAVREERL